VAVTSRRITATDAVLDRAPSVGQVSLTYRFDLVDGVSNKVIGTVHPSRESTPTLSHDTTRTVKRSLNNVLLTASESGDVDPLRDRVLLYMVLGDGREFPLGRYMFSSQVGARYTSGVPLAMNLVDEMFILDQETSSAFSATPAPFNLQLGGFPDVDSAVQALVRRFSPKDGVVITVQAEPSGLLSQSAWPAGTSGAKILQDLARDGGYFSPWFDHNGVLRFVRAFEPADEIPNVDLDADGHVVPGTISETSDLLAAPNRFVVISNLSGAAPVIGTYDVPDTAPHSIVNRGFVLSQTSQLQVVSSQQATQVARTIGITNTVFERTALSTTPDPRFDSYTVVKWRGSRWLGLAWDLELAAGGRMRHTLRKAYAT